MKDKENSYDAVESLGRIEGKVDIISDSQMKVMYALIGLIAAQLGVGFWPHSEIMWYDAATRAIRILCIITCTFLILRLTHLRKRKILDNKKYLCFGLICFSIAMLFLVIDGSVIEPILFWLAFPFHILFIVFLLMYAWTIKPEEVFQAEQILNNQKVKKR